jgi:hypothetical protein
MRRIALTAVSFAIPAFVLFLYLQRSGSKAEQSKEGSGGDNLETILRAPRLAVPITTREPGESDGPPAVASQDVGNDAGQHMLDEQVLMEKIRTNLARDPRLAEMLAREGRERFPDSPASDERDMLLVLALSNQHKIIHAHREAYYYVLRHPDGRYIENITPLAGSKVPRR